MGDNIISFPNRQQLYMRKVLDALNEQNYYLALQFLEDLLQIDSSFDEAAQLKAYINELLDQQESWAIQDSDQNAPFDEQAFDSWRSDLFHVDIPIQWKAIEALQQHMTGKHVEMIIEYLSWSHGLDYLKTKLLQLLKNYVQIELQRERQAQLENLFPNTFLNSPVVVIEKHGITASVPILQTPYTREEWEAYAKPTLHHLHEQLFNNPTALQLAIEYWIHHQEKHFPFLPTDFGGRSWAAALYVHVLGTFMEATDTNEHRLITEAATRFGLTEEEVSYTLKHIRERV